MVRFATELSPTALPALLRRMTSIVSWPVWEHRIKALKSALPTNPIWGPFLLERHGLEVALGDVKRYQRATGRCPWPPRNAREYRLYSFVAVAVQVHANLSARARARFAGAIRSALEKEFGLGPLAFEMRTVAHLMSRGFQIDFHDLESGGGYDFLASRGPVHFEVECKHISADVGRQIHRRKLYYLGGALSSLISRAVDEGVDGRLLQVTLPGRLTANKEQQQTIADHIGSVLSANTVRVDHQACSVSLQRFLLQDSPFCGRRDRPPTMQDIQAYLRNTFNIDEAHVLLHWRPGVAAVVVHFQSQRQDRVLGEVFKHLKADAKRQFSGTLPAFLCVHLADLTQEQLLELANADAAGTVTGIQQAASILLQIRPHLHTIALTADGTVELTQVRSHNRLDSSVRETGPSYVFRNPEHPMGKEPVLEGVFF